MPAALFLLLSCLVVTTEAASNYYIDSSTECAYTSNYEVYDWETVNLLGGRGVPSYKRRSTNSKCSIALYADTEYVYSSRTLKIDIQTAIFDNENVFVKIYDGSYSFTSDLKYTLGKYKTYPYTFSTSQPYVYIVIDKSKCPLFDNTCRNGFNLDMKITMEEKGLTTGALIGIIIGSLLGFGLLIGVPICICCCCCAAASSGGRRAGPNIATVTTQATAQSPPYQGTTAYPTQQYVIQGSSVNAYRPHNNAYPPQNPYTQQSFYQAGAPPPYPGSEFPASGMDSAEHGTPSFGNGSRSFQPYYSDQPQQESFTNQTFER